MEDNASTATDKTEYSDLSFTLYMRPPSSTALEQRQKRIREQLETLASLGVLKSVSVNRWSKEVSVPVESAPADERAVELFDEFRREVLDAGGRLEPFFEERNAINSFITSSPADRVLVFPVICVTIRRDGELSGLYPCWRDTEHHSVGDCLEKLENRDPVANLV